MNGIAKTVEQVPEGKLPQNYLDCMDSLNLATTIIDEEEKDPEDSEEAKKKKTEQYKKIQYLDKERKKKIIKQQKMLERELKEDLMQAKATADAKKIKEHVNFNKISNI